MEFDHPTLKQWQAAMERYPNSDNPVFGLAKALAALDRPADILELSEQMEAASKSSIADRLLRSSARALPRHPEIAEAYCRLAERRDDLVEACNRWSLARKLDATRLEFHLGLINSMVRLDRLEDAERAAMAGLMKLGNQPALNDIYARIAEMKGDWTEAASRWASLRRFAEHPDAEANRQYAEQRATQSGPDAPDVSAAAGIQRVRTADPEKLAELKKLLTGFESLGYNCEFGLLQRQFKIEQLGLLRYSETAPQTLLNLLKSRFEGMGDPDCMKIVVHRNEYRLAHNLSRWSMHTRIRPSADTDAATVLKDGAKRIGFLRSKLIKDLERPSKVFVYQKADLTDAEIDAIFQEIEKYGLGVLLCVRLYDAGHPRGTFEWRSERLMVAAIDRVGNVFPGAGWDISSDYWVHFCRIAKARFDELRQAAQAEQQSSAAA